MFGVAKIGEREQTLLESVRVRHTRGYIHITHVPRTLSLSLFTVVTAYVTTNIQSQYNDEFIEPPCAPIRSVRLLHRDGKKKKFTEYEKITVRDNFNFFAMFHALEFDAHQRGPIMYRCTVCMV